jgi:hypothetical protein
MSLIKDNMLCNKCNQVINECSCDVLATSFVCTTDDIDESVCNGEIESF